MVGLLVAGAILTRPDGLVYTLAFPAVLIFVHRDRLRVAWVEVRHVLLRYTIAVAVPTGAYLVLRLAVFGDWLPATARSKSRGLPGIEDLQRPVDVIGQAGWLAAMTCLVVVAAVMATSSPTRNALGGLLIPLGLAVIAFAILPADWMWEARFATPIWPLAALAAALAGVQRLRSSSARSRLATGALLTLIAGVTAVHWVGISREFRQGPVAPLCTMAFYEPLRLNAVAEAMGMRDGSFFGVDAGAVGLASRLRFIDGVGLTDARIARYWQDRDMAGMRDYVLQEQRPTFYMVLSAWDSGPAQDSSKGGPHLRDDPRFARDYVQVFATTGYARVFPPPGVAAASSRNLGVWVRRDAVHDAGQLEAGLRAAQAVADEQARLAGPAGPLSWYCGPVLRPGGTM
jgi:hypothetical protein